MNKYKDIAMSEQHRHLVNKYKDTVKLQGAEAYCHHTHSLSDWKLLKSTKIALTRFGDYALASTMLHICTIHEMKDSE